ncbi:MAG: hypothetical protein ACHQWV_02325 [Nitrospirales bacterium]
MSSRMIDILAGLLILLAVVKLILLSINAPTWLAAAKALYARPTITATISYLLAGVVLYVLLQSGLTIVQILAVCLFVMLLLIPGLAPYMGEVLRAVEGKTFRQILLGQWLYTLVWMILLGWGVCVLLFR